MGDIQRQADIARGGAQDRAIRSGAFGGSRSAILEAESQRPYVEQMARTSAGLRQSGFEQAQQAAQADLARQQQLGIGSLAEGRRKDLSQGADATDRDPHRREVGEAAQGVGGHGVAAGGDLTLQGLHVAEGDELVDGH